jgi:hypothetical protein
MLQKESAVLQSVSFLQKLLAVALKVRGKPVRMEPELTPWLVQRLSKPWRDPTFVKLQAEHGSRSTETADIGMCRRSSERGDLLASAIPGLCSSTAGVQLRANDLSQQ